MNIKENTVITAVCPHFKEKLYSTLKRKLQTYNSKYSSCIHSWNKNTYFILLSIHKIKIKTILLISFTIIEKLLKHKLRIFETCNSLRGKGSFSTIFILLYLGCFSVTHICRQTSTTSIITPSSLTFLY